MKKLLVMRHGKSGWKQLGQLDHDRLLDEQGKRDVPRMGQLLCEQGLMVDAIISSTARRASQTAGKMAQACGYDREITLERGIYLAPADGIVECLAQVPDNPDCMLVVGHNPGLEALVAGLTGQFHAMATAAVAHLELPIDCWAELTMRTQGQCADFWLPGEFDAD